MASPVLTDPRNVSICCISLNASDLIRLIGVPPQLVEVIRSAISNSWGPIQNERDHYGSYEFKLKGNPWVGQMEEAVRSRSLLVALLICMAQNGWNLLQAADTSKRLNDKDALYFEQSEPDPKAELFGMSFNMGDRLRLIDAPSQIREILTAAVTARIQIQRTKDYYGAYEMKLAGNPWYGVGVEGVQSKLLLCQIISNFRAAGYKLYASVDISFNGADKVGDLESWVFRRVSPPIWQ